MDNKSLRVGFMGFGEAGFHLGKGLVHGGVRQVVAYSRSAAAARPGDPLSRRAAEAGVRLLANPRELAGQSDVIIAVVPGASALPALRSVRRYLRPEQIYVDASTASVAKMEQAAVLLEGRAAFVDAAIMGSVPDRGLKVLIMASGPRAEDVRGLLEPAGMNIRVAGPRAGSASAMKLIRSICTKGLAAVLIETLAAAQRHGVLDAVAEDICSYYDGQSFSKTMSRYVCGTAMHAGRRVHEMKEVLEMLHAAGTPSRMTRGARGLLRDIEHMRLAEVLGKDEAESMPAVMRALVQAGSKPAV